MMIFIASYKFLKNFDYGHIKPISRCGTNNIHNLKAICSNCNTSMGTMNLFVFKEMYFDPI